MGVFASNPFSPAGAFWTMPERVEVVAAVAPESVVDMIGPLRKGGDGWDGGSRVRKLVRTRDRINAGIKGTGGTRSGDGPARGGEDVVEHRLGEAAGEGVLLAGGIGADQRETRRHRGLRAVADLRQGRGEGMARPPQQAQGAVPREPSQAEDGAQAGERRQLGRREGEAGVALLRERLVVGR